MAAWGLDFIGHYQVGRIQQGPAEAETALVVEFHIHPTTALAVDAQVDGMPARGKTGRLQEQVGQLRIDAAMGQSLGVEGAGNQVVARPSCLVWQ